MGRIMAMDYGTKRVGLAVTDAGRIIATPLETLSNHGLIPFLRNYTSTESVDLFVVGQPVRLHGVASDIESKIKNFIKSLHKEFPAIPVERFDERFTSKMAFQTMIDAGLKKKDRRDKSLVDKISAAIILQSYMEFIKNKELNA